MVLYQLLLNRRHYVRDGVVILNLAALMLLSFSAMGSDPDAKGAARTAIARQAAERNSEGQPVRLHFDFGDFKAWVRREGTWNVEGPVQHRGFLCGTYTVRLRVGHGNPGCMDVQWFREPMPVASVQLCNNALRILSGDNVEFPDAARFDEITCAERVVSCGGNCR